MRVSTKGKVGAVEAQISGRKAEDGTWEDLLIEYETGTTLDCDSKIVHSFKESIIHALEKKLETTKWDYLYGRYPEMV